MYALVHNNEIAIPPTGYNKKYFDSYLRPLGIEANLDVNDPGYPVIPISETISLIRTELPAAPVYNSLTEYITGPHWVLAGGKVTGTFQIHDKEISSVKQELKMQLAENRYLKEVAGTKLTIQGQEVTIETGRDDRHIWFQSLMLLPDGIAQKYKFPVEEIWIDLTKSDIGQIVFAIMTHVQQAFNWEASKIALIDAATTKEELEAIDIIN